MPASLVQHRIEKLYGYHFPAILSSSAAVSRKAHPTDHAMDQNCGTCRPTSGSFGPRGSQQTPASSSP
jgi:hypothetical protein